MSKYNFHYAVPGNTATEIIYNRADHKKEHMGLTSLEGAPSRNSKLHAETEFEKYRILQDQIYISNFDELLLNTKGIEKNNNKK